MCSISGTCGSVVTKFASWMHLTWMQSNVGFDLLSGVTGVKMDKSNFETTRVAQVVTAVHRDL